MGFVLPRTQILIVNCKLKLLKHHSEISAMKPAHILDGSCLSYLRSSVWCLQCVCCRLWNAHC